MKTLKSISLMLLSIVASLFCLPGSILGEKKEAVKIEPSVAKTKKAGIQALAVFGGVLIGNFAMAIAERFAPAKLAPFSPVVTSPGVVPFFIKGSSDELKAFGAGMLASGGASGFKNLLGLYTGPGSSVTQFVANAMPGRGSFAPLAGYDGQSAMLLRGLGAAREDEFLALGSPRQVMRTALPDEALSM
jgi:hypothetical protein